MDFKQRIGTVFTISKSFCPQQEEWIKKTKADIGKEVITPWQKFMRDVAVGAEMVTEVDTEMGMVLWDIRWYNKKNLVIDPM